MSLSALKLNLFQSPRALRALAIGTLLFGVGSPGRAQSPSHRLALTGSAQYAAGDFIFTQRTWSAYLSNGLTWSNSRLSVTMMLPIVMQDQGWVQYGGSGMMLPTGGISGPASSGTPPSGNNGGMMGGSMHGGTTMASADMPLGSIGIGDPVGRVEVGLSGTNGGATGLAVVGSAKAPLGSVSRGFSTGEWDAGVGLSAHAVAIGMMFFGDVMYWSLGNPPGVPLRNVAAYSVSVGRPLRSARWSVLGNVSGATGYWPGVDAPVQAGVGVGYLLESGSSVNALGTLGLTRTAPAASLGLGWRVPLGRER